MKYLLAERLFLGSGLVLLLNVEYDFVLMINILRVFKVFFIRNVLLLINIDFRKWLLVLKMVAVLLLGYSKNNA